LGDGRAVTARPGCRLARDVDEALRRRDSGERGGEDAFGAAHVDPVELRRARGVGETGRVHDPIDAAHRRVEALPATYVTVGELHLLSLEPSPRGRRAQEAAHARATAYEL